mmetsp:Transcript_103895/g.292372  ORF Transcript_103895/g.292372 Transcript_103895/m.292372 type:complete len:134 (+) Transcript_103895:1203-1604(+)
MTHAAADAAGGTLLGPAEDEEAALGLAEDEAAAAKLSHGENEAAVAAALGPADVDAAKVDAAMGPGKEDAAAAALVLVDEDAAMRTPASCAAAAGAAAAGAVADAAGAFVRPHGYPEEPPEAMAGRGAMFSQV